MGNIVSDERYINERLENERYFSDEYLQPNSECFTSPSGKYTLTIYYYHHEEGQRLYSFSKGVIQFDNNETIEIKRDYSHFPFCWVEHSSGNDFLLCGEDYQGYSVFDLENKSVEHFVPEEALKGDGFCWVEFHYKKGSNILAVEGCYWACPYEIVFYDISKPMDLPYAEIARVGNYDTAIGWKSDNTFEYTDEDTKEVKTIELPLAGRSND